MARLLAGQPVLARSPDALFNNVVHIGDLADFLGEALPALPHGHRVVTMAADEPQPIRRVVGILEAAARRTGAVRYEDGGKPFLISNDAARALGYRPSTVVDSIVRFARDVIAFASSSVS
jgi:nucleoside-diphosphate-sugar epimerase